MSVVLVSLTTPFMTTAAASQQSLALGVGAGRAVSSQYHDPLLQTQAWRLTGAQQDARDSSGSGA